MTLHATHVQKEDGSPPTTKTILTAVAVKLLESNPVYGEFSEMEDDIIILNRVLKRRAALPGPPLAQ